MVDMTKCGNGENCPKHKTCYRWLSNGETYQSYSDFYVKDQDWDCEFYSCLRPNKGGKDEYNKRTRTK